MNCLEWENTGCGRKNGCFECEKSQNVIYLMEDVETTQEKIIKSV